MNYWSQKSNTVISDSKIYFVQPCIYLTYYTYVRILNFKADMLSIIGYSFISGTKCRLLYLIWNLFRRECLMILRRYSIIFVTMRFRLYNGLWYIDVSTNSLRTFMHRNVGQCMHWCTHGVWPILCTFPSHDRLKVDIFQCKN